MAQKAQPGQILRIEAHSREKTYVAIKLFHVKHQAAPARALTRGVLSIAATSPLVLCGTWVILYWFLEISRGRGEKMATN